MAQSFKTVAIITIELLRFKVKVARAFHECKNYQKCQNGLACRAQTSLSIMMIFLHKAQNYNRVIDAKFQNCNVKDKEGIKV